MVSSVRRAASEAGMPAIVYSSGFKPPRPIPAITRPLDR